MIEQPKDKDNRTIYVVVSMLALVFLAGLVYFAVTSVIIPMHSYRTAKKTYESGNIIDAYERFALLKDYRDSNERAILLYDDYLNTVLRILTVGDTVFYGTYEQDNNIKNGEEIIEWVVLEEDENQCLLISRYLLDCQPYNGIKEETNWETCTLRKWLNNEFLNTAFSEKERSLISLKQVNADSNPDYNTDPGNNTFDRIFILSALEAARYYRSDGTRKCQPTSYAIAQGAIISSRDAVHNIATGWWWLRTPGGNQGRAARIDDDGDIFLYGSSVDHQRNAVRPCLWLSRSFPSS